MESMIIMCGIWITILPYMKWNRVGKKFSIFHLVIGLYTCFIGALFMINDAMFSYIWEQMAYIMICILLILEIAIKFKNKKVALDVLAIATSIVGLLLSAFVFFVDSREISSAIIMVVGSMIVLSIPFNRVKEPSAKSEK